jgi:hypothetical protein
MRVMFVSRRSSSNRVRYFSGIPENFLAGDFLRVFDIYKQQNSKGETKIQAAVLGIEHLTHNDVQRVMDISNGPDARKEIIYAPAAQTVAGKDTFTVKISAPVIHRRTNQVVAGLG